MLTTRQHELLLFIYDRIQKTGCSPSHDEMAAAMGLSSKSGVHRMMVGLEERGFVRRLAFRTRAIEVVKLPERTLPISPWFLARYTRATLDQLQEHLSAELACRDAATKAIARADAIMAGEGA